MFRCGRLPTPHHVKGVCASLDFYQVGGQEGGRRLLRERGLFLDRAGAYQVLRTACRHSARGVLLPGSEVYVGSRVGGIPPGKFLDKASDKFIPPDHPRSNRRLSRVGFYITSIRRLRAIFFILINFISLVPIGILVPLAA